MCMLKVATAAITLARETGDQRLEAGAHITRGVIHRQAGQPSLAADGHRHGYGCDSAIHLARPGAATRVRSWTPLQGPYHGTSLLPRCADHGDPFFAVRSCAHGADLLVLV